MATGVPLPRAAVKTAHKEEFWKSGQITPTWKTMTCSDYIALGAVVGTWALVVVTSVSVVVGWRLGQRQIREQLSVAREQLRVQFFLEMRKQFDGPLLQERKLLAQQFKAGAAHDEITERVPDFFEDLGMLVRRDYIDREMVWDTFSYYAIRWWGACKDYIAAERASEGGDTTLFGDFGILVETLYADEMKKRGKTRAELEPSSSELQDFLDDETRL